MLFFEMLVIHFAYWTDAFKSILIADYREKECKRERWKESES